MPVRGRAYHGRTECECGISGRIESQAVDFICFGSVAFTVLGTELKSQCVYALRALALKEIELSDWFPVFRRELFS
ncbi:MAG: hypothetical protein WCI55_16305, partial [Armatimonadota bacterium]